jgi:WD40 repeat protein
MMVNSDIIHLGTFWKKIFHGESIKLPEEVHHIIMLPNSYQVIPRRRFIMRSGWKAICWLGLALALAGSMAVLAQGPLSPGTPPLTANGKPLDPVLYPHPGVYFTGVNALAFSRDGTQLAVAAGPTISIIDVASGESRQSWPAHIGLTLSLAFDAEGTLVSTGQESIIKFWDPATGKEKRQQKGPNMFSVVSQDGKQLAVRDIAKGEVQLVDLATGRKLRALKIETPSKGGWTVMPRSDRELALAQGGFSAAASALALSPDGNLLATAGSQLKIWETATGKEVSGMTGHSAAIGGVAFSPDTGLLATGALDHTAKIWERASGRELRALAGHKSAVKAVAFSPDSRLLATGSWDNTVKLWEVDSGREVRTLALGMRWEVRRAQLEACGTEKPGGSAKAEAGSLYCTVSVTLRNASRSEAWFPTAHYKVFLHLPPSRQLQLQDALFKDEREVTSGKGFAGDTRYVAVDAGEEAEFSLVFLVPEDANRKELFLVVLDATPFPVQLPGSGEATGVESTIWDSGGAESEGYEFRDDAYEFQEGGTLVVHMSNGNSSNGTWKQNGDRLSFEVNRGYVTFEGRLEGDRITGTAQPRFGSGSPFIAFRRGGKGSGKSAVSAESEYVSSITFDSSGQIHGERQTDERLEHGVGENHPYVATVLESLAEVYKLKGLTKEAQEALQRAQRIKSKR